jgi:hypothetical protein
MSDFFNITSFLQIILCLLLGILYAFFLYRGNKSLSKTLKYGLFGLRFITVSSIAWLLFAPLIKTLNYTLDKPIIIIGQDNSLSIGQIKSTNFNQSDYEKSINLLKDKLSDKYEVKVYHFSDSVAEGFDFKNTGKITDANSLINKVKDEFLNRNIGAVILASDGIFNRGGNPLYEINKLNTSVYTIALGDTIAKRDVLVANVNYNNLVYLDDDFTVEAQLQAFQSDGEDVVITVLQNGSKIQAQNIKVAGNSFYKTVPIKLHAGKIGVQKFTVQASSLSNEITTKNNSYTFYVEVIDGKQQILLASATPHPDLAVLKESISTNKHFDVKVLLDEDLKSIDPSEFDLVVFYQLPDVSNSANNFVQKVIALRKPVWYILGAQSNISAFNQVQKQVNLASNGSMQEVYPSFASAFNAFSFSEMEGKVFSTFDPLLMPYGQLSVKANATVVFNQQIGKINTQNPLLFFVNENGLKAGYLMGEGLWRWKMSEAQLENENSVLNNLISNTVQYLSVKDDKRKFKVFSSKSVYDENENVQLNATLYNDNYQAVNSPEVNIEIKNDAGKVFNYTFSKTETAYALDAGNMPPGNYTYVANTTIGGKKHTANGSFYISVLMVEYQQTTANHQLLNTLSQQNGGKMYMPNELLKIADDIKQNDKIKTISYEDRKYSELINFKWLFAFLLIMMSIEWFLRKRNGEIN